MRLRIALGLLLALLAIPCIDVLAIAKLQLPMPTQAQSLKQLSLHDAVLLALRNNPDVESYELQRVVDKFALEVAQNAFAPQYSLQGSASYQQGVGSSYSVAPGISIATPIGTSASLNYSNNLRGGGPGTTALAVNQPLLQGFGPAVNKIPLENAKDAEIIARINFKNNVATIVASVIQQYYLVAADYNNLQVQRETLKQAEKILEQFRLKVKLGKMAPSDVVQQEANYASTRLSLTQQEISAAQDYQNFLQLLGLNPSSKLSINQKLNYLENTKIPDQKECIKIALKNNPSYRMAIYNLKIMNNSVKLAKNQQLWQLNLTYNQTMGGNQGAQVNQHPAIGANLNIPIHNLTNQQQLVNAKVAYDQARLALAKQRRALISQVSLQVMNINNLRQQIEIAERGVNLQAKALRDTELKQRYGKASVFDLTQQQTLLLQQRIGLINNRIALLNAIVNLKQLLGETLHEWSIHLRY